VDDSNTSAPCAAAAAPGGGARQPPRLHTAPAPNESPATPPHTPLDPTHSAEKAVKRYWLTLGAENASTDPPGPFSDIAAARPKRRRAESAESDEPAEPDPPQPPDTESGRRLLGHVLAHRPAGTPARLCPTDTERDFWDATAPLRHTWQCAQAAGIAPATLLLVHLARLTALVPPEVQGPALTGLSPIHLNWAGVVYGPAGCGKSSAWHVSRTVLPLHPDIRVHGPGTGEGLRNLYGEWDVRLNDCIRTRYAAVLLADEWGTVSKMRARPGSTWDDVFRSAWGGEILGSANAARESNVRIPLWCYRFVFIANMQPAFASELWGEDEVNIGMPQRFVYVDATRKFRPDNGVRPDMPPPMANPLRETDLVYPGMEDTGCAAGIDAVYADSRAGGDARFSDLHALAESDGRREGGAPLSDRMRRWRRDPLPPVFSTFALQFQEALEAMSRSETRSRREESAFRRHEALLTLKLAYAFAFLHSRAVPTEEDLTLAETYMLFSNRCGEQMRGDAASRSVERARRAGIRDAHRDTARADASSITTRRRERTTRAAVLEYVRTWQDEPDGPKRCTRSTIRNYLAPTHRAVAYDVIAAMLEDGTLVQVETVRRDTVQVRVAPDPEPDPDPDQGPEPDSPPDPDPAPASES
jgi:hypothetical protein